MKRIVILSLILLFPSCVGEMHDIKLSVDEITFTSDESSYVVTANVELGIDFVNEDNSSYDVPSVDDLSHKYVGNWIIVTNYGTAILIEVNENRSDEIRKAYIYLRGKSNPNNVGHINVIQVSKVQVTESL